MFDCSISFADEVCAKSLVSLHSEALHLIYSQDLPFGGTKYSGYGRFGIVFSPCAGYLFNLFYLFKGGPEGLRSLTNPKAIMFDRWPGLIQTTIPRVMDYPLRSIAYSWYVE